MLPLNQVLDELTTIMSDIIKKHKEKAISKESLSQITYSQFFLIHTIKEQEQATITELAEIMNITKPSLTAGVNKLIKLGLVSKEQSTKDKRIQYIHLTEKGLSIGSAEMNAFDECLQRIEEKLGDDFSEFERMLRKILAS